MSPGSRLEVLGLAVFPVAEGGLFALACLLVRSHPVWSAACLLGGSAIHTFTIHVFVHEALHHSDRRPLPRVLDFPLTVVGGVPFDGYRLHHHNHHRFANGADDFSRTWRMTADGPAPYGLLRYSLGWPVFAMRAGRLLRSQTLAPSDEKAFRRMTSQKVVLAAFVLLLGAFFWEGALLYIAMIYLGWALVSVHNYCQHPPEPPSEIPSITSSWYNRLLFNNGLHHEHHEEPGKAWHELRLHPRAEGSP
jgi:fatty acid desaturase